MLSTTYNDCDLTVLFFTFYQRKVIWEINVKCRDTFSKGNILTSVLLRKFIFLCTTTQFNLTVKNGHGLFNKDTKKQPNKPGGGDNLMSNRSFNYSVSVICIRIYRCI